MDHKLITFIQKRQRSALADHINIHAQRTIDCSIFSVLRKFLRGRYFVVVPERGEQDIHTHINNGDPFPD